MDEPGLTFQGDGFIGTQIRFDAGDGLEEAQVASAEAFGIGNAVAAEALADVAGLADVDDFALGIVHLVDTGVAGDLLEKLFSEPLDEGLFGREQELLAGRHERKNTPVGGEDKSFRGHPQISKMDAEEGGYSGIRSVTQ